ncbi:hypothetical protein [Pseudaestuariivita sp.]|uniref:hypothetical protein n=1 Tax=Pseudaestuariivita sp. TaxID=2211669 RepID=UPI004058574A
MSDYRNWGLSNTDAASLAWSNQIARQNAANAAARRDADRRAREAKRAAAKGTPGANAAGGGGDTFSNKVGGAVLIGFGVVAAYGYATKSAELVPAQLLAMTATWSFHQPREVYALHEETMQAREGSLREPPEGAFDVTSKQVIHRTDPVYETRRVAKTCTRNELVTDADGLQYGTPVTYDCSHDVQVQVGETHVYRTQYDYKIMRWDALPPLEEDGLRERPMPRIAAGKLCSDSGPVAGCERTSGDPTITYAISFRTFGTADGEAARAVEHTLPYDDWRKITTGQTYDAILNGHGKVRAIKGLNDTYAELAVKAAEQAEAKRAAAAAKAAEPGS